MGYSEIRTKIVVDGKEAEKELARVAEGAKNVKASAEAAVGGGGGGGGGSPDADGRALARTMADEFGKRAGVQIGKYIGGWLVNTGMTTAFALSRKVGRDNTRIDQAEETIGGAINGGTAGAMAAGPIGAAVGALLGGLNAFVLKEKAIRDSLDRAKLNYDLGERQAKSDSKRRQRETLFNTYIGMLDPQRQILEYQKHEKDLQGLGKSGEDIYKEYAKLADEIDGLRKLQFGQRMTSDGSNPFDGKIEQQIEDAEKKIAPLKKVLDLAASGKTEDENGKPLMLGGNKVNSSNFYKAAWLYSQRVNGPEDEKTLNMKRELEETDALRRQIPEKRFEVKLEMYKGYRSLFGDRGPITDSLSSKGMGVGATVSVVSQNEKVIQRIDRLIQVTEENNKSPDIILKDPFNLESILY